jgi:hypothetical protein
VSTEREERNPLRPLTGITRVITWIVGLAALLIVIANVAALGWLPGTEPGTTCVEAGGYPGPLTAGAFRQPSGTSVCVDEPSVFQRFADLGGQLPEALFAVGALALLLRFLRTASAEGPYATSVPGKLSALGWFVLLGGPVSALLRAVSQHVLRTDLIVGVRADDWLILWRDAFPWWTLAAGAAALTFAHILRIGVRMNEDLEGTI